MLIQALADFADNHLSDQMEDPAFETKPVPVELTISEEGRFLEWVPREESFTQGKKTFTRARACSVPRSPVNRNSGAHPLLAFDDAKYVLGPGVWTKENQAQDHEAKHAAFVHLIERAAKETEDEALRACVAFYRCPEEVSKAREAADPKLTTGILLSVLDGPVIGRPAVRQFWRGYYREKLGVRNEAGGTGMCLVTGKWGAIAPTHDKVKGAASLGGQAAGVALMSFDKQAFQSYGWEKNGNSPVSPDRAQAYVMALNHLMAKRDVHRVDHNGTAFLFWLRKAGEWDPMRIFEQADPDQVAKLLTLRGEGWQRLEANDFYFLAVTGNGGRLQVSQWIHQSLEQTLANVAGWFDGLRMVDCFSGQPAPAPKMWQLLGALVPRDEPPAARALELTRRALLGTPAGLNVLHAALSRMRAERSPQRLNPVRAGLIRLLVNDHFREGDRMMTSELDQESRQPAYLCGRLLALFDSLQYQASGGKVNQTVSDRYYSLASTQPRLAFPKLEDLGLKHLRKVRRDHYGAAVSIERQMDAIRLQIGTVFPPALSLVDQGRFALGFHHERAAMMQRAMEKKEAKALKQSENEGEQE